MPRLKCAESDGMGPQHETDANRDGTCKLVPQRFLPLAKRITRYYDYVFSYRTTHVSFALSGDSGTLSLARVPCGVLFEISLGEVAGCLFASAFAVGTNCAGGTCISLSTERYFVMTVHLAIPQLAQSAIRWRKLLVSCQFQGASDQEKRNDAFPHHQSVRIPARSSLALGHEHRAL